MWSGAAVVVAGAMLATPAFAQAIDPAIAKRSAEMTAAFNAKDSVKIGALYADDAVLMPPNAAVVKGRAGIESWFKGGLDEGFANLRLTPFRSEVSGDMAYVAGT